MFWTRKRMFITFDNLTLGLNGIWRHSHNCSKNTLKVADIDHRHIIGRDSLPWPITHAIPGSVTYLDLSTCITGQWAKHIDPVSQQTQNICRTFVQRRPNVFDVGPTLCKCYTSVLFLLGLFQTSPSESKWWRTRSIQCDVIIWLSALENNRRDEIALINKNCQLEREIKLVKTTGNHIVNE